MEPKKILMKIRLRKDGQWEHVYEDGSTDQEFYELNANSLAAIYAKKLEVVRDDYIEEAVEASGYRDAKQVLQHIMELK